jgi:cephalosporin hydroxylase
MAHMLDKLWSASGTPYEIITIDNQGLESFYKYHPAVSQKIKKVQHSHISFVTAQSEDPECVTVITQRIQEKRYQKIMVVLDSDHHAEHVRDELEAYAPLVTPGCYLIIEDTNIAFLDLNDWKGEGPAEAIASWLPQHPEFAIDRTRERFGLSWHPGGWLKRVE